ncbi:30S ribosomal protein S20 [Candidatus Fermentibacterales bacterium]|nr:30S ribosomal protein S20 [Candidatus Fermentibacterales bacterium]
MARSRQSLKRHRTDQVRRLRNRGKMSRLRTALKRVREADTEEKRKQAHAEAQRLLDRAGRTRLVHPRKARRLKSRISKSPTAGS